jgi:hypothetical protein
LVAFGRTSNCISHSGRAQVLVSRIIVGFVKFAHLIEQHVALDVEVTMNSELQLTQVLVSFLDFAFDAQI